MPALADVKLYDTEQMRDAFGRWTRTDIGNDVEHVIITDKSGKKIVAYNMPGNTASGAGIPMGAPGLQTPGAGLIVEHNHPPRPGDGGSFSKQDLQLLSNSSTRGVDTVIAHTENLTLVAERTPKSADTRDFNKTVNTLYDRSQAFSQVEFEKSSGFTAEQVKEGNPEARAAYMAVATAAHRDACRELDRFGYIKYSEKPVSHISGPRGLADLTTEELRDLDRSLTTKLSTVGDLRWHRDLTEAEKRVDFVQLAERFDTAELDIAKAVVPVLTKQRTRLIGQARGVIKSAKANKGATLAADVATLGAGFQGAYQSALYPQAEKLYQFGAQSVRKELGSSKKAADAVSSMGDRIKQLIENMARSVTDRTGARAGDMLFQALIGMVGNDDWDAVDENLIAGQVEKSLGDLAPKIAKEGAGYITGRVINLGRQDAAQEFKVNTASWSAILDTKTCPLCKYLDGMRIAIDDPDYLIFTPGELHPWDRCIRIFLTTDDPDSGDYTWETPPLELVLDHAPNLEWAVTDFPQAA